MGASEFFASKIVQSAIGVVVAGSVGGTVYHVASQPSPPTKQYIATSTGLKPMTSASATISVTPASSSTPSLAPLPTPVPTAVSTPITTSEVDPTATPQPVNTALPSPQIWYPHPCDYAPGTVLLSQGGTGDYSSPVWDLWGCSTSFSGSYSGDILPQFDFDAPEPTWNGTSFSGVAHYGPQPVPMTSDDVQLKVTDIPPSESWQLQLKVTGSWNS